MTRLTVNLVAPTTARKQPGRRYGPPPTCSPDQTGHNAPMSSMDRKLRYADQRGAPLSSLTSGMTPAQRRRWGKKLAKHAGPTR